MKKCRASFEWRALNLASEVWDGGFQPWIFWIIEPSFWKGSGSCSSFPGSMGMSCGFWMLPEASLLWPYPAHHCSSGAAVSARQLDILFSTEKDEPELAWRLHMCPSAQGCYTEQCMKQQTFAAYSSGGFSDCPHPRKPLSPGGLGRLVTLTETCQWPEGGWGEGRITGWSHHCTGIAAVDWWSRLTTVSWQQNNILQSRWTDLTNTSKVMPAAFWLDSRVMLLLKYHAVA